MKKYRFALFMGLCLGGMFLIHRELGANAVEISCGSLLELISFLPPIFILLGLMDVWVPKETMIKYLGEHSGLTGVIISFVMGSATAGPLYGAFPVAAVLMRKGAKFSNVLIFIGAWSTTKIPMFMFEISSLGARFAVTRLIMDIIGILIIAYTINRMVSQERISAVYKKAEEM